MERWRQERAGWPWRADWLAGLREVDYPQQRVLAVALAALPGPVAALQALRVPVVAARQQAWLRQKPERCRPAVVQDREPVRGMLYRLRARPTVAELVVAERLKRPRVCKPLRRVRSPAVQPNPLKVCRRPLRNPAPRRLAAESRRVGKRIQGQVSHSLKLQLPRPMPYRRLPPPPRAMLYRLRVRPPVAGLVVAERLKRPRVCKPLRRVRSPAVQPNPLKVCRRLLLNPTLRHLVVENGLVQGQVGVRTHRLLWPLPRQVVEMRPVVVPRWMMWLSS